MRLPKGPDINSCDLPDTFRREGGGVGWEDLKFVEHVEAQMTSVIAFLSWETSCRFGANRCAPFHGASSERLWIN